MTDAEFKALEERYRKAVADSTPEDEAAFARDTAALAGDWVAIGQDMRRAIDKVGTNICKCGLRLVHHLNGGACGRFEPERGSDDLRVYCCIWCMDALEVEHVDSGKCDACWYGMRLEPERWQERMAAIGRPTGRRLMKY